MEDQNIVRPVPGIGRVFKKSFADIYDHLGLVVAGSFIWLVAALIPVTAGVELQRRTGAPAFGIIGLVVSLLIAALLGVGLFYLAHKAVYKDDPGLGDLFIGFRSLFLPAAALAFMDLVITGIIAADIAFFFGLFPMSRELAKSPAFFAIGVFFVWVMFFWLMSAMYHGPVLIASHYMPELEVSKPTTLSVLRRGALLALGAPFFTMVFLFVIIAVTILSVVSRVGMAIFVVYPGIVAFILVHAARSLFIRYGVIEERPEVVEDDRWKLES